MPDTVPEHKRPSPVNPSLHVQLCEPMVLVQVAFTWQSWLPVIHSSISSNKLSLKWTMIVILSEETQINLNNRDSWVQKPSISMSQLTSTAFPFPLGSNQYLLLMASWPSLAFISWHDFAGSCGMDPKGAVIENRTRKWKAFSQTRKKLLSLVPVLKFPVKVSPTLPNKFPSHTDRLSEKNR